MLYLNVLKPLISKNRNHFCGDGLWLICSHQLKIQFSFHLYDLVNPQLSLCFLFNKYFLRAYNLPAENKKDTPGSCFQETYTLVDEINDKKKKKKIQIITIGNVGDVKKT